MGKKKKIFPKCGANLHYFLIIAKIIGIFVFDMLQRVQSIWMFIASLFSSTLFFVGDDVDYSGIFFLFGLVTGGVFFNIFNFKKRKNQIFINRVLILINALLIGLLVYWLLNLSGGIDIPEKGIEPIFPILAIVCLIIANTHIRRDERLVKSVDRLR